MNPWRYAAAVILAAAVLLVFFFTAVNSLGSASALALAHGTGTVCGVVAGGDPRNVLCARVLQPQQSFGVLPNVSFDSISGGRDFVCGLRSGGTSFFCWNPTAVGNFSSGILSKRVYIGSNNLSDLSVGEYQVSAVVNNGTGIRWWREDRSFPKSYLGDFKSLTSGSGFTCGIATNSSVQCWGSRGFQIQTAFANLSMQSIIGGDSHVCGIDANGLILCRGSNSSGQLNAPFRKPYEFSSLALGANHSCAVQRPNGTVVCWGAGRNGSFTPMNETSFALIVAGGELTCGLTTLNFSIHCWSSNLVNPAVTVLSLPRILPGICRADSSSCKCGILADSASLCSGSGVICNPEPCALSDSPPLSVSPPGSPPPSPSPPLPSTTRRTSRGWLAFAIVGSVGGFAGLCTIIYCLWTGVCRQKKVYNSVQPTIAGNVDPNGAATTSGQVAGGRAQSPFTSPNGSRSRIFRRQSSRSWMMRRQRSGPSSFKDRAEEFTYAELAAATRDFSLDTKIGGGSFGTVYKGKLPDGREVAIKRSESGPKSKKFQEKESAFQSELSFLSRLHHKHLVGLVGYCEEKEERLLVYEYMKNGALFDHLHGRATTEGGSSPIVSSWKMRIKILLDAARGIEYLHNYAVPPIIHRDIKSSNILLDSEWTARVSDFGLSLMGDGGRVTTRAGTVGYMDPEYYGMHHLTVKSDIYGFGVVMLEVLTGKRAIFKDETSGNPASVVDVAVPSIVSGEVGKVLDIRAGKPAGQEAEAVELVAYTAVHCVSLEGRERPAISDIVANLESAYAMCDDSNGGNSLSSNNSISVASMD